MVEAEREVEHRVAEPCTLGIEKDGPLGTDQDVLRAHVAVYECDLPPERLARQRHQGRCEGRVDACRRLEVRLEANGMKHRIIGESLGYRLRVRGGCVDRSDGPADTRSERRIHPSLRELGLPYRKIGRIEELHRKRA